ncbi:MAG: hypothetical protein LZ159_06385 [Thaumarchaeota archaeon]|nr:hypothetical protein [Candidatus Terraquivivens yellowstonensis]
MPTCSLREDLHGSRIYQGVDKILNKALDELVKEVRTEFGERDLSEAELLKKLRPYQVMVRLESKCHEIYNKYEERVREKLRMGLYGSVDQRKFEKSLDNARKARAGATLEKIFLKLLDLYKVKYVKYEKEVQIGEAEFDFVVPDKRSAVENPERSVLISLKREVRERWKLTIGDAYIIRKKYDYPVLENIWFASLGQPPLEAVTAMVALCIVVYVPNNYYDEILRELRGAYDLSEQELARIKPFSKIVEDALDVMEGRRQFRPCVVEKRRLRQHRDLITYFTGMESKRGTE